MDTSFRNAIAISTLIHSALFAPFPRVDAAKFDLEPGKPVKVDYVYIKEPAPKVLPPEPMTVETPKIDIAAKIEVKPADEAPAPRIEKNAPKEAPMDDAKRQARIGSTRDYINYYQLIREKIRKRLKSNYGSRFKEGEVALAFTLSKDGRLIAAGVNDSASTDDAALRDIATSSVREASPFAPFPAALSLPEMTFDLTVTFKRR